MRLLSYKNIHVKILRISHRTPLSSVKGFMLRSSVQNWSSYLSNNCRIQNLYQTFALTTSSYDDILPCYLLPRSTPEYRIQRFQGKVVGPEQEETCDFSEFCYHLWSASIGLSFEVGGFCDSKFHEIAKYVCDDF